MVKTLFYSIIMSMLMTACSNDTNEKPYTRKPMNVVIQKNAAWDGFVNTNETEDNCKGFVLSEKDINEFFMVAQEETEQGYSQGQLTSRCYAEGTLSLPRKYKGRWRIDKSRRGILMVENDQSYFFYCDQCVSRKFSERP